MKLRKNYDKDFLSLISKLRPIEFYGLTIHMKIAASESFGDTLETILKTYKNLPPREKKSLLKLLQKTVRERPQEGVFSGNPIEDSSVKEGDINADNS